MFVSVHKLVVVVEAAAAAAAVAGEAKLVVVVVETGVLKPGTTCTLHSITFK
jgi:hypothetical protein